MKDIAQTSQAKAPHKKDRKIHHPHDGLFCLSMKEPRVARYFIRSGLPSELVARLSLDTLHLEKETFIDKDYTSSSSDVVFSVQIDGSTAYIYLLFEVRCESRVYMIVSPVNGKETRCFLSGSLLKHAWLATVGCEAFGTM